MNTGDGGDAATTRRRHRVLLMGIQFPQIIDDDVANHQRYSGLDDQRLDYVGVCCFDFVEGNTIL